MSILGDHQEQRDKTLLVIGVGLMLSSVAGWILLKK